MKRVVLFILAAYSVYCVSDFAGAISRIKPSLTYGQRYVSKGTLEKLWQAEVVYHGMTRPKSRAEVFRGVSMDIPNKLSPLEESEMKEELYAAYMKGADDERWGTVVVKLSHWLTVCAAVIAGSCTGESFKWWGPTWRGLYIRWNRSFRAVIQDYIRLALTGLWSQGFAWGLLFAWAIAAVYMVHAFGWTFDGITVPTNTEVSTLDGILVLPEWNMRRTEEFVLLALISIGYYAHLWKRKSLGSYAVAELVFGIVGGMAAIANLELTDPKGQIALASSAFVIVRGLENLDKYVATLKERPGGE